MDPRVSSPLPPASASGRLARWKDKAALDQEKARIEEKKAAAGSIIFRHIVEKKDLATAYFEVFPDADCSRTSAKRQAGRLMKWFRINYPIAIRQLLWLKGFNDDKLVDLIAEQLQATLPNRVITTRKLENGAIERTEKFVPGDQPDWKTRADAVQKLIILGGHHARRNLKPSAKEAAIEEGSPIPEPTPVRIPPRRKLPDDEWQKEYQRVMEESNASGRADKMIRDLERRVAEAEAVNGDVTHGRPFMSN